RSTIQLIGWCDELFRREKCDDTERLAGMSGQRIESSDGVDLVPEKFDSDRFFVGRSRINLDYVAADAETTTREIHVVALVKHLDQPPKDCFTRGVLSPFYCQQHPLIIFRRRDTVNAGNARDHNDIAPA